MLNRAKNYIFNIILIVLGLPGHLAYFTRGKNIRVTQEDILLRITRKNSGSEYGRKHDFSSIGSADDFRSKVPVTGYDAYATYIGSILNGNKNVLTSEEPLFLQPSSGSSAPSKLIPLTKRLRREFLAAIHVWMTDVLLSDRNILCGKMYFLITPPLEPERHAGEKVKVGFEDIEYFSAVERLVLKQLLAVPQEVRRIKDMEDFKYVTALFLLKEKDLGLISVWNPVMLSVFMKSIFDNHGSLTEDLRNGFIRKDAAIEAGTRAILLKKLGKNKARAHEIEDAFKVCGTKSACDTAPHEICSRIWPRLALISCWADGNAAYYLDEIRRYFPNVRIQPKGLIATEAFVSFPLTGEEGSALAINSHFFEFIDLSGPGNAAKEIETILAHQIRKGRSYGVMVTTGGGLYRYNLNDIVEVAGFRGEIPLIRFKGKIDQISDLVGEKLNNFHVEKAMSKVFNACGVTPAFCMLAPDHDRNKRPFYTLYLSPNGFPDNVLPGIAAMMEKELSENFHYSYARSAGQLLPVNMFVIDVEKGKPQDIYLERMISGGKRAGNIKPPSLDKNTGWSGLFPGEHMKA
ncbi:MAG: GH3 auxin-responsive promoter family protein [Syntrophorhabdaceae bacterium]|nr:GH3 auxin-responsive promoter family protein [Syntrophorhabdaceae bacterium]